MIEDTVPGVAPCQIYGIKILPLPCLNLAENRVQVVHGVNQVHINIVFLHQLMVEIPELGQGRILISGHAVNFAVYPGALPQNIRDKRIQGRRNLIYQLGNVHKRPLIHKPGVIGIAGKHNIKGVSTVDHGLKFRLIVIPANNVPLELHAYFFPEILIDSVYPFLKIFRKSAADPVPANDSNVLFFWKLVLCLAATGRKQTNQQQHRQHSGKGLFDKGHGRSPLLNTQNFSETQ